MKLGCRQNHHNLRVKLYKLSPPCQGVHGPDAGAVRVPLQVRPPLPRAQAEAEETL